MPKLSEKQKRFAESYIKTFDAGRSAIEAGYSEKSAPSIGSRLLKKPQVAAYLNQLSANIQEKTEVEVGEIIAELRKIAFASAERKVSNSDRIRALELLGKTLAMYTESHAFENNRDQPIEWTEDEQRDYKESARLLGLAQSAGMPLSEYLASEHFRPRLSG